MSMTGVADDAISVTSTLINVEPRSIHQIHQNQNNIRHEQAQAQHRRSTSLPFDPEELSRRLRVAERVQGQQVNASTGRGQGQGQPRQAQFVEQADDDNLQCGPAPPTFSTFQPSFGGRVTTAIYPPGHPYGVQYQHVDHHGRVSTYTAAEPYRLGGWGNIETEDFPPPRLERKKSRWNTIYRRGTRRAPRSTRDENIDTIATGEEASSSRRRDTTTDENQRSHTRRQSWSLSSIFLPLTGGGNNNNNKTTTTTTTAADDARRRSEINFEHFMRRYSNISTPTNARVVDTTTGTGGVGGCSGGSTGGAADATATATVAATGASSGPVDAPTGAASASRTGTSTDAVDAVAGSGAATVVAGGASNGTTTNDVISYGPASNSIAANSSRVRAFGIDNVININNIGLATTTTDDPPSPSSHGDHDPSQFTEATTREIREARERHMARERAGVLERYYNLFKTPRPSVSIDEPRDSQGTRAENSHSRVENNNDDDDDGNGEGNGSGNGNGNGNAEGKTKGGAWKGLKWFFTLSKRSSGDASSSSSANANGNGNANANANGSGSGNGR
ncbi:MAG: hypothetical protein M1823_003106 [Watsoniomyces obsoletus]|nr:MAG: hypothetical protein M1823_003106 [Watsoniomyces obsoletus]